MSHRSNRLENFRSWTSENLLKEEVFSISSQFGMFSILNEVLQKLEDGSPKAKLLFDFIIRIFQKKNDKSIVMRCFLRDFVGANDSGRF